MKSSTNKLLTTLFVGLMAAGLASCTEPKSKTCPTGVVCPSNMLCAETMARCVDPASETECPLSDGTGIVCNTLKGESCPKRGRACIEDGKTECETYQLDEKGKPVTDEMGLVIYTICDKDYACVQHEPKCVHVENGAACGNGIVEGAESCDDGNTIDNDGCSSTCKEETCGDGVVQRQFVVHEYDESGLIIAKTTALAFDESDERTFRIEICDPGEKGVGPDNCLKEDTLNDQGVKIHACRTNLKCGNGIVDPGEACDHGKGLNEDNIWVGMTGKVGTPECSTNCDSTNVCGNGVLDAEDYQKKEGKELEECDPGAEGQSVVFSAEYAQLKYEKECLDNCLVKACGNGRVDPGEECDPGSYGVNTDKCNNDCTLVKCGDGKLNPAAEEECDPGTGATADPKIAQGGTATCTQHCKSSYCGDGVTNVQAGEQCDVKDNPGGTNCTHQCQFNVCGDRYIGKNDLGEIEYCDDGKLGSEACTVLCTRSFCGDGIVNNAAGEQCDHGKGEGRTLEQGGTADCNYNCTFSGCGDGIVNELRGEQCDPGTGVDLVADSETRKIAKAHSDKCTNRCTVSICGDGIVNNVVGEECDVKIAEGSTETVDTQECNSDCHISRCGDGYVNEAAGEECDPKTGITSDSKVAAADSNDCTKTCAKSFCGDGYLNEKAGEECDWGNEPAEAFVDGNTASCNASCTTPRCGDGVVNVAAGEECDPGSGTTDNNKIAKSGSATCSNACKFTKCGDGYANLAAGETCDPGTGTTENPKVAAGFTLMCTNVCSDSKCGDGIINAEAGEACDKGDANVTADRLSMKEALVARCRERAEKGQGVEVLYTDDKGFEYSFCLADGTVRGRYVAGNRLDGCFVNGTPNGALADSASCVAGGGVWNPVLTEKADVDAANDRLRAAREYYYGTVYLNGKVYSNGCYSGTRVNWNTAGASESVVCAKIECFNGSLDFGEVCERVAGDNGAYKYVDAFGEEVDYCSSDCRSTKVCGNGVIDDGEACDPPTNGCQMCTAGLSCGNGKVETGEACDTGSYYLPDNHGYCVIDESNSMDDSWNLIVYNSKPADLQMADCVSSDVKGKWENDKCYIATNCIAASIHNKCLRRISADPSCDDPKTAKIKECYQLVAATEVCNGLTNAVEDPVGQWKISGCCRTVDGKRQCLDDVARCEVNGSRVLGHCAIGGDRVDDVCMKNGAPVFKGACRKGAQVNNVSQGNCKGTWSWDADYPIDSETVCGQVGGNWSHLGNEDSCTAAGVGGAWTDMDEAGCQQEHGEWLIASVTDAAMCATAGDGFEWVVVATITDKRSCNSYGGTWEILDSSCHEELTPVCVAKSCKLAYCGDGFVQTNVPTSAINGEAGEEGGASVGGDVVAGTALEECDHGAGTVGTEFGGIAIDGEGYRIAGAEVGAPYSGAAGYCNYNCRINKCGDGIVNAADGEQCDWGSGGPIYNGMKTCPNGATSCKLCTEECVFVEGGCGNGKIESGADSFAEVCDTHQTGVVEGTDRKTYDAADDGVVYVQSQAECDDNNGYPCHVCSACKGVTTFYSVNAEVAGKGAIVADAIGLYCLSTGDNGSQRCRVRTEIVPTASAKLRIKAVPKEGYQLKENGWEISAGSGNSEVCKVTQTDHAAREYVVECGAALVGDTTDGSIAIKATFEEIAYNVVVTNTSGTDVKAGNEVVGTVAGTCSIREGGSSHECKCETGASGKFACSGYTADTVTLTATPAAGYAFVEWSGGCPNAELVYAKDEAGNDTTTVQSAKCTGAIGTGWNIEPVFQRQHVLSYDTGNHDAGFISTSVASGTAVNDGTQVTLVAISNAGYYFDGWKTSYDGSFEFASCAAGSSVNPCVIVMHQDETVYAQFSFIDPVLSIRSRIENSGDMDPLADIGVTFACKVHGAVVGPDSVYGDCSRFNNHSYTTTTIDIKLTEGEPASNPDYYQFTSWTGCTADPADRTQCSVVLDKKEANFKVFANYAGNKMRVDFSTEYDSVNELVVYNCASGSKAGHCADMVFDKDAEVSASIDTDASICLTDKFITMSDRSTDGKSVQAYCLCTNGKLTSCMGCGTPEEGGESGEGGAETGVGEGGEGGDEPQETVCTSKEEYQMPLEGGSPSLVLTLNQPRLVDVTYTRASTATVEIRPEALGGKLNGTVTLISSGASSNTVGAIEGVVAYCYGESKGNCKAEVGLATRLKAEAEAADGYEFVGWRLQDGSDSAPMDGSFIAEKSPTFVLSRQTTITPIFAPSLNVSLNRNVASAKIRCSFNFSDVASGTCSDAAGVSCEGSLRVTDGNTLCMPASEAESEEVVCTADSVKYRLNSSDWNADSKTGYYMYKSCNGGTLAANSCTLESTGNGNACSGAYPYGTIINLGAIYIDTYNTPEWKIGSSFASSTPVNVEKEGGETATYSKVEITFKDMTQAVATYSDSAKQQVSFENSMSTERCVDGSGNLVAGIEREADCMHPNHWETVDSDGIECWKYGWKLSAASLDTTAAGEVKATDCRLVENTNQNSASTMDDDYRCHQDWAAKKTCNLDATRRFEFVSQWIGNTEEACSIFEQDPEYIGTTFFLVKIKASKERQATWSRATAGFDAEKYLSEYSNTSYCGKVRGTTSVTLRREGYRCKDNCGGGNVCRYIAFNDKTAKCVGVTWPQTGGCGNGNFHYPNSRTCVGWVQDIAQKGPRCVFDLGINSGNVSNNVNDWTQAGNGPLDWIWNDEENCGNADRRTPDIPAVKGYATTCSPTNLGQVDSVESFITTDGNWNDAITCTEEQGYLYVRLDPIVRGSAQYSYASKTITLNPAGTGASWNALLVDGRAAPVPEENGTSTSIPATPGEMVVATAEAMDSYTLDDWALSATDSSGHAIDIQCRHDSTGAKAVCQFAMPQGNVTISPRAHILGHQLKVDASGATALCGITDTDCADAGISFQNCAALQTYESDRKVCVKVMPADGTYELVESPLPLGCVKPDGTVDESKTSKEACEAGGSTSVWKSVAAPRYSCTYTTMEAGQTVVQHDVATVADGVDEATGWPVKTCLVTMDKDYTVAANYTRKPKLTASIAPPVSGTGSHRDMSCAFTYGGNTMACVSQWLAQDTYYFSDSELNISADAGDDGYEFLLSHNTNNCDGGAWAGSSGAGTCQFTVSGPTTHTVYALFTLKPMLNIVFSPEEGGTFDYEAKACDEATFAAGTTNSLGVTRVTTGSKHCVKATPNSFHTFDTVRSVCSGTGWTSDSGSYLCSIDMSEGAAEPATAKAVFTRNPAVTVSSNGGGTVTCCSGKVCQNSDGAYFCAASCDASETEIAVLPNGAVFPVAPGSAFCMQASVPASSSTDGTHVAFDTELSRCDGSASWTAVEGQDGVYRCSIASVTNPNTAVVAGFKADGSMPVSVVKNGAGTVNCAVAGSDDTCGATAACAGVYYLAQGQKLCVSASGTTDAATDVYTEFNGTASTCASAGWTGTRTCEVAFDAESSGKTVSATFTAQRTATVRGTPDEAGIGLTCAVVSGTATCDDAVYSTCSAEAYHLSADTTQALCVKGATNDTHLFLKEASFCPVGGWSDEGVCAVPYDVGGQVVASFKGQTTLTYEAMCGTEACAGGVIGAVVQGEAVASGAVVPAGKSVTVTTAEVAGDTYEFLPGKNLNSCNGGSWTSGASGFTCTFEMTDGGANSVIANYTRKPQVTFCCGSASACGDVSATVGTTEIDSGAYVATNAEVVVTASATAADDYEFLLENNLGSCAGGSWVADGTGFKCTISVTEDGTNGAIANYTKMPKLTYGGSNCAIAAVETGTETALASDSYVATSTSVTVTVTPSAGYEFISAYNNGTCPGSWTLAEGVATCAWTMNGDAAVAPVLTQQATSVYVTSVNGDSKCQTVSDGASCPDGDDSGYGTCDAAYVLHAGDTLCVVDGATDHRTLDTERSVCGASGDGLSDEGVCSVGFSGNAARSVVMIYVSTGTLSLGVAPDTLDVAAVLDAYEGACAEDGGEATRATVAADGTITAAAGKALCVKQKDVSGKRFDASAGCNGGAWTKVGEDTRYSCGVTIPYEAEAAVTARYSDEVTLSVESAVDTSYPFYVAESPCNYAGPDDFGSPVAAGSFSDSYAAGTDLCIMAPAKSDSGTELDTTVGCPAPNSWTADGFGNYRCDVTISGNTEMAITAGYRMTLNSDASSADEGRIAVFDGTCETPLVGNVFADMDVCVRAYKYDDASSATGHPIVESVGCPGAAGWEALSAEGSTTEYVKCAFHLGASAKVEAAYAPASACGDYDIVTEGESPRIGRNIQTNDSHARIGSVEIFYAAKGEAGEWVSLGAATRGEGDSVDRYSVEVGADLVSDQTLTAADHGSYLFVIKEADSTLEFYCPVDVGSAPALSSPRPTPPVRAAEGT